MYKVKITVLKKTIEQDYVSKYIRDQKPGYGPCRVFEEGQEFVTDVWGGSPSGFCSWAWNDLYKPLLTFAKGGDFGNEYEGKQVYVSCCSDSLRNLQVEQVSSLPDAWQ